MALGIVNNKNNFKQFPTHLKRFYDFDASVCQIFVLDLFKICMDY